mgnify:FL=1|tara:strand:+ start:730 stop:1311 length:582 start_codon:yes stop_codon:yes gene_type:complete
MNPYIKTIISKSIEVKQSLLKDHLLLEKVNKVCEICLSAYKKGNKIILAGNGGSAADSQHIAAEFVSRFEFDRPGLPALALTTDTSILTAIGNDYGYENLFSRQLEAQACEGDIFIGITTSGTSPNILKAFDAAIDKKLTTIGFCGSKGISSENCDYVLKVPSDKTARIQESHILIGHIICGYIEKEYFKDLN